MVTLTFDFDKEKLAQAGKTEDEMLEPMRVHAKKYGIDEVAYGVFKKDGKDAMCHIGTFVVNMTRKDTSYVSYFKTWFFDVNGDVEDCVVSTKERYKRKRIPFLEGNS